ncbi:uncharacterized protein LOC129602125 [Paramacrobiotus metropolitanus]|uniref:uncharacterized protein LOC129602125 n=1 Tax=Paramacrobiotus metropolitanus TaxID=2943436 RepID=UPI0024462C81|nr:uncharacterized protein LOC129602125 [Paramacrobiotus metropolitanus]
MVHFLVATAAILLLLAFLPGYLGCSTQKGLTVDRLHQILNEAKQRNGNGVMQLHGYGRGRTFEDVPAMEWPPNTQIIRAPEGGTLHVPCKNNNTKVSHIEIPPAYTYRGRQVTVTDVNVPRRVFEGVNYRCNFTEKSSPGENIARSIKQVTDYDPATGAFSIALEDFTNAHSGLYECLHSNGSQRVVTQRYYVSATLLRHDVFQPPMPNVTARYGEPAEMECPVHFRFLPGHLTDRFLWRRGRYLLMGDSIPEMADKAMSWRGFYGHIETGINAALRCHATLKIRRVTWNDAGLYECWFRVDDGLDEWIVQEAYLHVI